jgi:hypothetical protein
MVIAKRWRAMESWTRCSIIAMSYTGTSGLSAFTSITSTVAVQWATRKGTGYDVLRLHDHDISLVKLSPTTEGGLLPVDHYQHHGFQELVFAGCA